MSAGIASTTNSRRLIIVVFFLTFGFTVVVGRLAYYQIFIHERLVYLHDEMIGWDEELPPKRGYIADANGHVLALDVIEWDISASPNLIGDPDELSTQLAELLGKPKEEVLAALTADVQWIQLAKGVDYETGEAIAGLGAGGILVTPRSQRYYPEGSLTAHLLGIVNANGDGFYGVEGFHNQTLEGSSGTHRILLDPFRRELPIPPIGEIPAQAGASLILTLDRNIQYIAHQELQTALSEYRAEKGTVIVMDPQTGAVLAAVSYPTFNPNDFANEDPKLLPDPSVTMQWEPGSIFKIITWAAALDAGTISPGTTYYDGGSLEVGGRIIRNWDRLGHGLVTMTDALVESLNTVAALNSTGLGKDRFYTYLRRFGFGTETGVDLDAEAPGQMKLPGDSNWFPSELGTNAFGQGIAVTPLQMIAAVAAVANEGMLMKPYIVQSFIARDPQSSGEQVAQREPMVVRRAISPEAAETLTAMLVEVVERGAVNAKVPGYRIAGKTGTAEVPTPYGYHTEDTIASFVGFAPADDPEFIVLVKLDKPRSSRWGSQTAAPTFRAIAERLFTYMQIPPDEIRLAQRSQAP